MENQNVGLTEQLSDTFPPQVLLKLCPQHRQAVTKHPSAGSGVVLLHAQHVSIVLMIS